MWKKHDLVSAETCLLRDRVLSRVTPRILTRGDIETAEPATSMLVREGSVSARCLVPKIMVSDLSGLRARPLRQNQVWRWVRHCSSSWTLSVSSQPFECSVIQTTGQYPCFQCSRKFLKRLLILNSYPS